MGDVSNYITRCMSIEQTDLFLRMMGEPLESFVPMMLRSEGYRTKNDDPQVSETALERMARAAMDLGCEYVTNIHAVGYTGPKHGLFDTAAEELILFGTGLSKKNPRRN